MTLEHQRTGHLLSNFRPMWEIHTCSLNAIGMDCLRDTDIAYTHVDPLKQWRISAHSGGVTCFLDPYHMDGCPRREHSANNVTTGK